MLLFYWIAIIIPYFERFGGTLPTAPLSNTLPVVDPFWIYFMKVILIRRKAAVHIEGTSSDAADAVNKENRFSIKQFKAEISLMISHKAGDVHGCTLDLMNNHFLVFPHAEFWPCCTDRCNCMTKCIEDRCPYTDKPCLDRKSVV